MRFSSASGPLLPSVLLLGCISACVTLPVARAPAFVPPTADPGRKARLRALAPRLDQHFQQHLAETRATGLAVGIILDGELTYARGFGVRDVRTADAVDIDTVFRIASMTKSFTAAAVLKLRDKGKLILDAPAATYLSELQSIILPTRDSAPFTVRQLLTNASGLPYDDSWGVVSFGTGEGELTRLLQKGVTFGSVPGTRYAYSNLGYALLGRIVERVSGSRFRDYVTAEVLRPLGMRATVWESGDVPPARLAVGFRRMGDELLPEPTPPSAAFEAGGGLYTSMRDYARYVAFQLAAYPARDDPEAGPLRRSSVREMHAGQRWSRWRGDDVPIVTRTSTGDISLEVASYGYGWLNLTSCANEGTVQHFGGEPGYWSTVHLLPNRRVGVVTFSTTAAVGSRTLPGTLALLRAADVLPAADDSLSSPEFVGVRASVGRLLERWDGELVQRTFDSQSLRFPWMSTLHDDFQRLSRDHGPCRSAGWTRTRSRTEGSWKLDCDRGAILFSAALTPANPPKVQLLRWTEDFPPDERLGRMANLLADSVGRSPEQASELFAASPSGHQAKRNFAHLSIDHDNCRADRSLASDGRGRATYRLGCSRAALDLAFAVDEVSGKVTEVTGRPPLEPEGVCAL